MFAEETGHPTRSDVLPHTLLARWLCLRGAPLGISLDRSNVAAFFRATRHRLVEGVNFCFVHSYVVVLIKCFTVASEFNACGLSLPCALSVFACCLCVPLSHRSRRGSQRTRLHQGRVLDVTAYAIGVFAAAVHQE